MVAEVIPIDLLSNDIDEFQPAYDFNASCAVKNSKKYYSEPT